MSKTRDLAVDQEFTLIVYDLCIEELLDMIISMREVKDQPLKDIAFEIERTK